MLEYTAAATPLLLAGGIGQIESLAGGLGARIGERLVLALACDPASGASHSVNVAAGASFPGDLVVVAPGVRVAANWLERLSRAATSDSTVATATPLSIGAGGMELFAEDHAGQTPHELSRDGRQADDLGAGGALFPRIASVGPGCAYIRRSLLDLVGPLDETLPLEAALARLAMRAIAAGMVHVTADDVLVKGLNGEPGPSTIDGETALAPVDAEVRETLVLDERTRLQRAMAVARTALRGLSVTIDGRALTNTFGGTQTYIIELILALAHHTDVTLRVLIPPDLSQRAATAFATVTDLELVTHEQVVEGLPLTDVVHRPQPAFTADDVTLLRLVGKRVVIGQLDLIAYHNYSYHRDIDHWRAYRRTTRLALGAADQVVFFSEHARRDALSEDLLPEERSHVVGIGVDGLESTRSAAGPPDGVLPDDSFLLCLGADYTHKNRCFAIELLGALRDSGWTGTLVLAGSHVPFGSSRQGERELLARRSDLMPFVHDLGTVEESSKQWLLEHARALLYPTLYEGFGLLPLEAARAGLPCLFAPQASLSELAGRAATLVAWDAVASALAVLPLLSDGPARAAHLARLNALEVPTWDETARRLLGVYERALATPPPEAAPRVWQELDREDYVVRLDQDLSNVKTIAEEYQAAYQALSARVATGLPLIDRGGLLSEDQQRGLMRVASRRSVGSALLAPLGWLGRLAPPRGTMQAADVADLEADGNEPA